MFPPSTVPTKPDTELDNLGGSLLTGCARKNSSCGSILVATVFVAQG
jgi:hypothetical protein